MNRRIFCDGGDAFPVMESGRAAERRVHHRSQGARAPGACGLGRCDGSHGAMPWRFSSARRVAPFGRARRWDWQRWAREHAQATRRDSYGPKPRRTAGKLRPHAKKLRNEPNHIVCNQWLSVSSSASARVAGRRAAPGRDLCRANGYGSRKLGGHAAVDHQVVRGDVPASRAPTAPRATPRTWSGARDAQARWVIWARAGMRRMPACSLPPMGRRCENQTNPNNG
jgi:hypothetical protein